MGHHHDISCSCGALGGGVKADSGGCHLVCFCADCRAAAFHLGVGDQLVPGGGSPLYQVLPAAISLTRGQDHLACLRLSPKGLLRWYAACCNTPFANTVGSSRVPLAGMWRGLFADPAALGPVVAFGFTKAALPGQGAPARDKGLVRMLGGALGRGIRAYAAGTARHSPFFGDDGVPVVQPQVISPAARKSAYGAAAGTAQAARGSILSGP